MNKSKQQGWLRADLTRFFNILMLCGVGLLTGCCIKVTTYTIPPAPCNMEGLFVDKTIIPEPLVEAGQGEPADRFGVEFEQLHYTHPQEHDDGKIRQIVYRGLHEQQATRGYKEFVDTYFYAGSSFHCRDIETVWDVPAKITFQSSASDEWQLGCTVNCSTEPPVCQYIGRYGVYFVWYYAWMSDIVTYREFENILEDIDSRMAQCLEQVGAE